MGAMGFTVKLIDSLDISGMQDIPAGGFSNWLKATRSALTEQSGIDVPCGECNACCRSSYFIHFQPGETETLSHIPSELLFAAPGLPKGNVLMGYDDSGCCPMLADDTCSIYEHRPVTCRTYDCRVFPATGIDVNEKDKTLVSQQARRWKFDYPTEQDRAEHLAAVAAARFLSEHSECFTDDQPVNSTQFALFSIKVIEIFLRNQHRSSESEAPTEDELIKSVIESFHQFKAPEQ
jgi:Fe-S-cluster containining protein